MSFVFILIITAKNEPTINLKEFAEKLKERYVDENLLRNSYFRIIEKLLKEYEQ